MQCDRCHYSTSKRSNYLSHLRRNSPCPCTFSNVTREELVRVINLPEEVIICTGCQREFTSVQYLKQHVGKCSLCPGTFPDVLSMGAPVSSVGMSLSNMELFDITNAVADTFAVGITSKPACKTQELDLEEMRGIMTEEDAGLCDIITNAADAFTVGGKRVRKTNETPPRVSVIDLISVIDDTDNNQASKIFARLKNQYPEIAVQTIWGNWKFPGARQKDTPVTDARGVVTIINLLSGRRAAQFRAASADVIVRYLGGDTSLIAEINRNADAQQHLPANNIARLFGEDVETSKYTANKSTLQIESGPLAGFDGPGVYIIYYGEKLRYDQTAVPQNAQILGFGHAKNSGYERCKEHKQLTGPTTRVIDFIPTPHYEHCEKMLENRLKGTNRIVKGKIVGKPGEMREQFWTTSRDDYDAILKQVQQDVYDLKVKYETSELVLIEREKTKQVEFATRKAEVEFATRKAEAEFATRKAEKEAESAARIAEAGVRSLELQLEIMKFTAQHAKI